MSDFNRNELKNKTLAEFRPVVNNLPPQPPHLHLHTQKAQSQNEDFDYDAEEEASGFFEKFKLIFPIILIAIICFIGYAWYTDKFAISKNNGGQLPVIKASNLPLREKPEDPGGMKIVNRDKKVYDAISGKDNDKDTKATNILPAPEEPITHESILRNEASAPEVINNIPVQEKAVANEPVRTTLVPEKTTQADPTNKIISTPPSIPENTSASTPKQELKLEDKAAVAETQSKAEPEKNTSAPAPAKETPAPPIAVPTDSVPKIKPNTEKPIEKVKAVTSDDITDVIPKKKPTPQKRTNKTPQGHRVQLGSYRSTGDAEASWITIQKKFPDILSNLNDYIEKADLGDKGIYYRLQLYGFKNEAEARKVCQKLTTQKQGCFFVGK